MRHYNVDVQEHQLKISKSNNGLVIHSDIHRCSDGLLNIHNLQIDANYADRNGRRTWRRAFNVFAQTNERIAA